MKIRQTMVGAALLVAMLGSGVVQADEVKYRYCMSSVDLNNSELNEVITSIFRTKGEKHNLSSSYKLYIEAEFGDYPNVVYCPVFESYQQAENSRNSKISDYRKSGWKVHIIHWSYHGD